MRRKARFNGMRWAAVACVVLLASAFGFLVEEWSWTERVWPGAAFKLSRASAQGPTVMPIIPGGGQLGDANADGRCTEVDALQALKMAVGQAAADVAGMDVDGDGQVTEVDALQILKWAVAGGFCRGSGAPPTVSERTVRTEAEAIKAADDLIAREFPDMVGAEKTTQGYVAPDGEFYDVAYQRTVQIDSRGMTTELPRVVIVSIDRNTGEHFVAVSD